MAVQVASGVRPIMFSQFENFARADRIGEAEDTKKTRNGYDGLDSLRVICHHRDTHGYGSARIHDH